jgi:two-component system, OmpR family, sensor histidine kinase ChvG
MTAAPKIDVRDLNSVRRAARDMAAHDGHRQTNPRDGVGRGPMRRAGEVLIGDDWVSPDSLAEREVIDSRRKRGLITLNRSPLARKIITFNLIALILLVAGMLYFTSSRDNLAFQRANGLVNEAQLVANVFEAQMPRGAPVNLVTGDGIDAAEAMAGLDVRGGAEVFLFDTTGRLVAQGADTGGPRTLPGLDYETGGTVITDLLNMLWDAAAGSVASRANTSANADPEEALRGLVLRALGAGTVVETGADSLGRTKFSVAVPVIQNGAAVGVVAMTSATGEIDRLVRREREQVLQMFVVGILVSIGLSLVLASTIANPIADLAAAAELGRDRNARRMSPGRIRIPDLTARPDEIGRLSAALRGMVSALYERIEGNEQFAADVAHEIKNPLASLRSAVGTMRVAKREDQREKLLEVIEHDVRRLDRLVTDIASASRLDSELVKEEEKPFDLLKMLGNLKEFLSIEAQAKGIDFIDDLPPEPIIVQGLEGRLAQVFVNLITNAISFCEDGDAIRVWARKRENRVLVVVEDTGPGIPEDALEKIFQRFYSERPAGQFGNNSGLGLAISKQIVEAHGGVIWAENIRPTEADATSDPLGARFVVGLPV